MREGAAVAIDRWCAALAVGEEKAVRCLGGCVEEARIPANIRRRMGPMERMMARCALGVMGDLPAAEIILCSRYGNVDMLVSLLRSISQSETLSPMAFSLSVHNAAAGLLGQIRGDRTGHTALAAGRETLLAGLIEGYARLATDPRCPVALLFGDWPLPEIYERFTDLECGGTAMAWLMRPRPGGTDRAQWLEPVGADDRAEPIEGAEVLARRLVSALESGSDLVFRGRYGPAWRLAGR